MQVKKKAVRMNLCFKGIRSHLRNFKKKKRSDMILNEEVTVRTIKSTLPQGETEVREAKLADKNLGRRCKHLNENWGLKGRERYR